jgi:NADH-quinone oxidoreductase subunit M
MGIGLSLRVPIWPLHGWFTEVAKEAPFSVFVALSAGTVPVAIYIFIKICYLLFPEILGNVSFAIVTVGVLNLIMGGLCAISQRGLRQLFAFICISEVGLVMMGVGSLSSTGLLGAVYHELIFGLGLAGFGLLAGLISDRTGHSEFLDEQGQRKFGGIATLAPGITVFAGLIVVSLLGFPGLGGFVGHALVIIGSYSIHPLTVVIAGGALLLASSYLFSMYRSIFLGEPASELVAFKDLTVRERTYLFPVVACLIVFGVYPKPLIELIRPTVLTLLSSVK